MARQQKPRQYTKEEVTATPTAVVRIPVLLRDDAHKFCRSNGMKLGYYVAVSVAERLAKDRAQEAQRV